MNYSNEKYVAFYLVFNVIHLKYKLDLTSNEGNFSISRTMLKSNSVGSSILKSSLKLPTRCMYILESQKMSTHLEVFAFREITLFT